MAIDKQLIEIAENVPRVYNAGSEKGYSEGYDVGYSGGYDKGKTDGAQSEYDNFWDYYQDNGTRTDYQYAFAHKGWRNANFKPKYPLNNITAATSMFSSNRMTRVAYPIDLSNCANCSYMFSQCASLTTISELTFSETITNASNMFASCKSLTTITVKGTIATAVVMGSCPLNRDSILSVVNALSNDVTGKTLSLNKAAVNAAFTTEEWDAVAATKSNWTITLA